MSAGGDDPTMDLDVLDAEGERIGRLEGVPMSTLARHLPVTLDDDAKSTLDVDDDTVDLPSQLIQRRGNDEIELSRNMSEIHDLLAELEALED